MKVYFEMELDEDYNSFLQAEMHKIKITPFELERTPVQYKEKRCFNVKFTGETFGSKAPISDMVRMHYRGNYKKVEERVQLRLLNELSPYILSILKHYKD